MYAQRPSEQTSIFGDVTFVSLLGIEVQKKVEQFAILGLNVVAGTNMAGNIKQYQSCQVAEID